MVYAKLTVALLGQIQYILMKCLLHSFAVRSSSCCINPSFKMHEDLLQANLFGETEYTTTAFRMTKLMP